MDNLAGKAKKGKAKGKKTKAPAKKKKAQHPADEKPAKKQKKVKEEEEEEEEEEACNKVQANPTFSQDGMFEVLVEGNDVYDANLSQSMPCCPSPPFPPTQIVFSFFVDIHQQ